MYSVKIHQQDGKVKEVSINNGENLLSFLRRQGLAIPSPCGGKGICGKCKVRVLEGEKALNMPYLKTKAISEDEWNLGYRLSCRIEAHEDLAIEVLDQNDIKADILVSGNYDVELNPYVTKKHVKLAMPSIDDQLSDVDRLEEALEPAAIEDINIIRSIPDLLRKHNYEVTATLFGDTVISVEGGNTEEKSYGIAIDIGTTTVAGVLINLYNGKEESVYSSLNPQKAHGDDVISRIDYTIENEKGLETLSNLMINEINKMIDYFIKNTDISRENIYHIVVVGNTVMMHLLAGITPKNIAVSPFIPAIARHMHVSFNDLGINIPNSGKVTLVPMVAGYVGADTVGAILTSEMTESNEISLLIDIGTNGEIALGNKDKVVTCSTAAGPAFEGGHIRCGLGGVTGAINKVIINKDSVEFTTIGGSNARGICGSGVVDVAAQLLKRGLLESYGRILTSEEALEIVDSNVASRIVDIDGKPAFMLAFKDEGASQDVFITQKDIREIQLAKGAIAAGIRVLMNDLGVDYNDVKYVYLAGGFGNYIDHDHALDIGLIPKEFRGKIVPIGNGALTGSKMILKSKEYLKKAEEIKRVVKYIELSSRLDFQSLFVEHMEFA